jgi:hypothetical protein
MHDRPDTESSNDLGAIRIAPRDHLSGDAAAVPVVAPDPTLSESATALAAAPSNRTFTLLALLYLAAWAGAIFLVLDHRFDRRMDWNTSYFSIAARNLAREGFVKLRGGIYLTAGQGFEPGEREFYSGHPPMTAWLLAGWMKLLGPHAEENWAIRALPLAFSVLNLLLLWVLVRKVFGAAAATLCMIVTSILPMIAFYSQNVNMEPFVLTFMLGASLGYLSWARPGSRAGFVFMCLCIVLGCWTDWPMYLFSGFLGVLHVLKRPDRTDGRGAGRSVLGPVVLIVLPVLMFGAFIGYLRLNGSSFADVKSRAQERMTATADGAAKPSRLAGYKLLGEYFDWIDERGKLDTAAVKEFKTWFVDLFTPAALLLGAMGAIFWRAWSRRLSIASGEPARRAMFRIVLAMLLTQLTYTLAFPQGAWKHEFWQYYLAVPVAIMAGGLLMWLTIAGGTARRFRLGLADRVGWAVAALIPILAIGPMLWRLHVSVPGKPAGPSGQGLHLEYGDALKRHTGPSDLIVTDMPDEPRDEGEGVQKALPWYADRYILADEMGGFDTTKPEGIDAILKRFPKHRIVYLWEDEGGEKFFEYLNKKPYPRYEIPLDPDKKGGGGSIILYLLQGDPESTWRKAGIRSGPGTRPSTTRATR